MKVACIRNLQTFTDVEIDRTDQRSECLSVVFLQDRMQDKDRYDCDLVNRKRPVCLL